MSDNVLRIIPTLPDWVPVEADMDAAVAAVRTRCADADDVVSCRYADVTFIDPGANFECVRCPECAAELDLAWWHEQMDDAFATRFTALGIVTPCCGAAVSLNDLDYDWPAGFARFEIQIRNPDRSWLSSAEADQVSTRLGTGVRQILSHY